MFKKLIIVMYIVQVSSGICLAQSLSLDSCKAMATRNYPLSKQADLIEKSRAYSIENAKKGKLPQVSLSGSSTYQSDILTFPFAIAGSAIEPLRQDQHRLYGEINQPITDLWNVKNQKKLAEANSEIEQKQLDVELFKLKETINQVYFGILLIDEQKKQVALLKSDINNAIEKVNIAIENGTSLNNNAAILTVELLKADQRVAELNANRSAYLQTLSLLINQPLGDDATLQPPPVPQLVNSVVRPELGLFKLQQSKFAVQNKLLINKTLPKVSFYFQGGYGAPGLNTIDNDGAAYYITGLKLNWNISSFYTLQKDKALLNISSRQIDIQQEQFMLNLNINLKQQGADISKIQSLIALDNNIIEMRASIKQVTQNQLALGTATPNDFLTQLNAEDQARQQQIYNRIQLLLAQNKYFTTLGN